jgi:hypothetical protein
LAGSVRVGLEMSSETNFDLHKKVIYFCPILTEAEVSTKFKHLDNKFRQIIIGAL